MSVLVIVELNSRPDRADDVAAAFRELVPVTRAYDGCEGCQVYVDQDDPTRFSIVETFASRAHYERYFAWRQERGDLDSLGELLSGPPAIGFFDDIGA